MRLLRRNTVVFGYRRQTGEEETLIDGRHTGNMKPVYGEPVQYRGSISAPSGYAAGQFYGIDTPYTHVLLLDDPNVDIDESGLIEWKGDAYEIKAVRRSLNVLAVALKKQTQNHAAQTPTGGD